MCELLNLIGMIIGAIVYGIYVGASESIKTLEDKDSSIFGKALAVGCLGLIVIFVLYLAVSCIGVTWAALAQP